MRAWQVQKLEGPDGLRQVDLPDPRPGPGQVLVNVEAVSLNFRDLLVASGKYGGTPRPDVIPTSDGAGVVTAVGEGVTRFKPGDRVAATFFQTWTGGEIFPDVMKYDLGGKVDGMLAEQVVAPEQGLVAIPEHLSSSEAATLPCAALTAWHALVSKGNVKAGDTVLVLGTGGVSIFALQFARMSGARVIATSSSEDKIARLKELGAEECVNYRATPEWDKRIWELTGKRGVDHVVEVGGAETLGKSLACARYGGRVSLIGVLTGAAGEVNPVQVLFKSLTVQGIYVGSREMFEAMNRAISQAKLQPIIDRSFRFSEAREAYRYLQSGAHFGKVVIEVTK